MICIIALIVFGILGVFSAKYRIIAKEAFNCVFKKLTFRKCDTGLDTRLKAQITTSFHKISPPAGRVVYKYFEWFSWAFLILTLVTLFFMGQGLYNFALYGNCNGPQGGFCIYDPLGPSKPVNTTEAVCSVPVSQIEKPLIAPAVGDLKEGIFKGNPNAKVVIIEFGCYSCHYTNKEEETVKKVINHYGNDILYVYKDFPLTVTHENALLAAEAAHCALDQGKYWEYRDYLFANQPKQNRDDLLIYASELGLEQEPFKNCLDSGKYKELVEKNYKEGVESGIRVTPTFFINNKTIIGAVEYSEFRKIINSELGVPWWQFWR